MHNLDLSLTRIKIKTGEEIEQSKRILQMGYFYLDKFVRPPANRSRDCRHTRPFLDLYANRYACNRRSRTGKDRSSQEVLLEQGEHNNLMIDKRIKRRNS